MAVFTISPPATPLVRAGTAGRDTFNVRSVNALLAPGLAQDAGDAADVLRIISVGGSTLTDLHFAGLANFEQLRFSGTGLHTVTLGAAAEAAFGPTLQIRLTTPTAALTVDGSALSAATALAVSGGVLGDSILGGAGADTLLGDAGDDTIDGGAGADRLEGGDGADLLSGGDGKDLLLGGDGADTLTGGAGIDDLRGEAGQDSLSGGNDADKLLGGADNDTLAGDAGNDLLQGDDGQDLLMGGTGADTLLGGGEDDTLEGGDDADRLEGGDGADLLTGDQGTDLLMGGAGADTLTGGEGNDNLFGGTGADIFTVTLAGGADRISDFVIGEDRLDVSAHGIATAAQALALGRQSGDGTVFTFADGTSVTLRPGVLAGMTAAEFILAPQSAPTDLTFLFGGGSLLSGGRDVGVVRATDPNSGETFTYTVDDPRFEFVGDFLRLKAGEALLEDAITDTVTLRITATDSFGLTYSEDFVVDVLTPALVPGVLTVPENRAAGALVGDWGVTGFAVVGPLTFEVVTPGAPFAFNDYRMITTEALNYETLGAYPITVRVTDQGTGRVVERNVTITVEDQTDTNLNETLTRDVTGADGVNPGDAGESLYETPFTAADNPAGTSLPDVVVWNSTITGGDGAAGNDGGAGGDVAAAIATITARTGVVNQIGQDLITVNLATQGGAGGNATVGAGGQGGAAASAIQTWDSLFSANTNLTFNIQATGGAGGNGAAGPGGDGGTADALFDLMGTFPSGGMNATFDVVAIGGAGGGSRGGAAGAGGDATVQITAIRFGGYAPGDDETLVRIEATATGGAGSTRGDAKITIDNNVVELGAGDDTLALATYFDGASHTLVFSTNEFHGNAGTDLLDLSGVYGGFGATVNLTTGRMTLGESPLNVVSEFEHFIGTESADRFIDAGGPQVYRGGSGDDVFVFAPGGGHDSINDFTQGDDLLDVQAYGFADFAAITIVYGGGVVPGDPAYAVVVLDGGSSLSITLPDTIARLTAADFLI
ncbi:hypothetical protein KTR66_18200 [Roseococcus sp. SDR]|uniref:calcium-binding protein n=1 Tax=Roseococcus sp. SDR TaxID=2835532 RepID=UPI001BD03810|nr:hypothetical protein [Roseococcus sp. SDR]MBS7791937.1 hypothetical protein [Roseococcus sp. SDR]MBV1847251.1 hypothetical protein [Roseococcus sp. SDR]